MIQYTTNKIEDMGMKTIFKKTIVTTACMAALSVPFAAQATNGYFSHGYGIKAKGIAGAGVAFAQDAMAAATNPAAIIAVGNRVDVGAELFRPDRGATTLNNGANATVGTFDGNDASSFLIPEFGYTKKIDDTMSWGLVVYGNGGMNTDYSTGIYSSNGAGLNDQAQTGVDLAQLFIAPTFAMKLNDHHTVGVSLNLAYQRFKATGLSDFIGYKKAADQAALSAGLSEQGYDSSTGVGIKLGWTGKMSDMLTVGATYQSKTRMSEFDKYNKLFAEAGDFDIPAHFSAGISVKATPSTTVVLDVQRIQYGDIKSIANPNNGTAADTFLGDSDGKGFGWDDMTVVKLGLSHRYNKDLVLRAGWNHGGQPIGADDTSFNLIAPAVVEDHVTLGATWTLANGAELSAYYMHAMEETLNGSTIAAPGGGGANLRMDQDAIGIAYGWDL